MIGLVCAFVAVAVAAPADKPEKEEDKSILHSEMKNFDDGSYSWSYEAADGSIREESATLITEPNKEPYLQVRGSYRYIDSEGKEVVIQYSSDDHGFNPEGSTIPEVISETAKNLGNLPPEED